MILNKKNLLKFSNWECEKNKRERRKYKGNPFIVYKPVFIHWTNFYLLNIKLAR